jgi:hypothetical protein
MSRTPRDQYSKVEAMVRFVRLSGSDPDVLTREQAGCERTEPNTGDAFTVANPPDVLWRLSLAGHHPRRNLTRTL